MEKSEFEELYTLCKRPLERFVYYRLSNKADADDVLQEVAIKAFLKMDSVKSSDSFKSWIFKIAANMCNDYYRILAKRHEIPLDALSETVVSMNLFGICESDMVRETLFELLEKDKQILYLFYFKNKSQQEIAQLLKIPVGTVKSRLFTAKNNFKKAYPYLPKTKGAINMKKLPGIMPEYKITKSEEPPFEVRCEEVIGWFMIPKLGEKLCWAMYDFPERTMSEWMETVSQGPARVHGIDGVEILTLEHNPIDCNKIDKDETAERRFVAQLTDTHCRLLAENHVENGVKVYYTFLDGDDFLDNWGFGEDNCGKEVNLTAKGLINRSGCSFLCPEKKELIDVVGRYTVEICGKTYDTVCLVDIELYNGGVLSEQFIDRSGKTVLWRRFNANDWHFKHYGKLWSELKPDNEVFTVNAATYVHWYDCISDYIL